MESGLCEDTSCIVTDAQRIISKVITYRDRSTSLGSLYRRSSRRFRTMCRAFEKSWINRRNFQASFGLKTEGDDLKDGDIIFEASYDPFSAFRMSN